MVKIENMKEATARIEAALYSAGRPLIIEDIIRASGTESKIKTLELLNAIKGKLDPKFVESSAFSIAVREFLKSL